MEWHTKEDGPMIRETENLIQIVRPHANGWLYKLQMKQSFDDKICLTSGVMDSKAEAMHDLMVITDCLSSEMVKISTLKGR